MSLIQTVTIGYQDPVDSTDLTNRLLSGIVRPGVYRGGEVSAAGTGTWNVNPLVAEVMSQDVDWTVVSGKRSQARVEFFSQTGSNGSSPAATLAAAEGYYIVVQWQSGTVNPATAYTGGLATITAVSAPGANDVVLCKITSGAVDYSARTNGYTGLLQYQWAKDNSYRVISGPLYTTFPPGTNAPSQSMGVNVLSLTITPRVATSTIVVDACVFAGSQGSAGILSVFLNTDATPIVSSVIGAGTNSGSLWCGHFPLRMAFAPQSTATQTVKVFLAGYSGSYPIYYNGEVDASGSNSTPPAATLEMGGKIYSTLSASEILS